MSIQMDRSFNFMSLKINQHSHPIKHTNRKLIRRSTIERLIATYKMQHHFKTNINREILCILVTTPQLLTTNISYWTNNVRTAIGPKLLRCNYEHFRLPKEKRKNPVNFMEATTSAANQPLSVKKRRHTARTSVEALGDDVLCMIFVLLDLVHLIRCSAVCRSWYCSLLLLLIY